MKLLFRLLLIVVILFNISSFIWFLLGATAYFQRGMDIIGTVYLWGLGFPCLIFAILFSRLLIKRWIPVNGASYAGVGIGIALSILFSISLILSVGSHHWTDERIKSDSIKITEDEKYEYRIDLINLFQRNSRARLYLKDANSGEELSIPVDIRTKKIIGLGVGKINHWVQLEPTDNPSHYILRTTKDLRIPEERFEVNIASKTARRME